MHTISRFAPALRAALALPVVLALAACPFPKDIGDSPLDSTTDAGTTTAADPTTTTAPSPTASETGETTEAIDPDDTGTTIPPLEATTSTVTGDEATTSDTSNTMTDPTATSSTDETTTLPPDDDGMCYDEFHGEYWCQCSETLTKPCRDDGVQVCLLVNHDVIVDAKWSVCGVCDPGDALACDADGEPGKQFCNLNAKDLWIDSFDQAPTAAWGACVPEADIVCQPNTSVDCNSRFPNCIVDAMGVPFVDTCF